MIKNVHLMLFKKLLFLPVTLSKYYDKLVIFITNMVRKQN